MSRFLRQLVVWHREDAPFNITENFRTTEFQCHCGLCEVQMISSELVAKLQILREKAGKPIKVTSAYRCSEYQKHLRGQGLETAVGQSTHERGEAVDIVIAGDRKRFFWFLEMLFKAIGDGGDWVHVDLRKDKVRRWRYRTTSVQADPGTTS